MGKRRFMWILALSVVSLAASMRAQSLQAVVGIAYGGTYFCQQTQNAATGPLTASCQGSGTDAYGSGSGSGTATANYGSLQLSGNVTETVVSPNSSNPQEAVASIGTNYEDFLTFPQLSVPALLKLTVTISGSVSGDPHTYISAAANMLGASSVNAECDIFTYNGTCTTTLPVSPGDQVTVGATLDVFPYASIAPGVTGSSSATVNYSGRKLGATYAYTLVSTSTGKKLNVPIVSASGTKYPTK